MALSSRFCYSFCQNCSINLANNNFADASVGALTESNNSLVLIFWIFFLTLGPALDFTFAVFLTNNNLFK